MIFQRALLREFGGLGAWVFLALASIAITTRLVRLLGQAAAETIPPDVVGALLGFFILGAMPTLLSLGVFVSVLMGLTRSWRDSEMVIWFVAGQSLTAWLRPVLVFAAPQIAIIAALTLLISPWVEQVAAEFRARAQTRDDLARITPGVFHQTMDRSHVFFAEAVSSDSTRVKKVFIASGEPGDTKLSVSDSGHVEKAPNGDRFMVLENGRHYDVSAEGTDYRVTEFERYKTRIEAAETPPRAPSVRALPTRSLLREPTNENLGELTWRIGLPILSFMLALSAIPMSFVSPRAGRSVNLLLALVTYFTYSNLLGVSGTRVTQGALSFTVALLVVHGGMALILLALFAQRLRVMRLRLSVPGWLTPRRLTFSAGSPS